VRTVTIYHAKYGSDANVNWKLEASTNGGSTWTAYVSSTITSTSTTLTAQTINVNLSGNVRFRIVNLTSGERFNIEDIDYTSLSTSSIRPTSYCTSSAVSVPFTVAGGPYVSGNVSTAQLSDASGSFAAPTSIG